VALPKFAKKPIVAAFRKAVQWNLALRRSDYRYVFVLAHMRSGSTLLSHILTSHHDFAGAGETHTIYRTPADLPNLVVTTCEILHKLQLSGTYVVDQINHDEFLTDEILSSPQIHRCIILIRTPEATLKSMMNLFGMQDRVALGYYVERLETLVRYSSHLRERALLVEYDDLVDRTQETLAALTQFFAVDPPFTNKYVKSKVTGKVGDPSQNILSGRIIRTQDHKESISAEVAEEAILAFRNCRRELLSAGVLPATGKVPGSFPQTQRII
jgi:hypothetical protein